MHIHIHIHIHIHMHIYIYKHKHIHIHIHIYIHTYVHAYIHTYIHTYVHRYKRVEHQRLLPTHRPGFSMSKPDIFCSDTQACARLVCLEDVERKPILSRRMLCMGGGGKGGIWFRV